MILPAHRLARRSTRSLLIAAALVATVTDVRANPSGAAVVHGAAAMQQLGSELQITNAAGTIIDWQAFSIGSGETTRFVQPSIDSAVLNRVVGGDASELLGQLLSNGQVFLVNPNGVVFGGDAVVDTAGFVASTLPLTNEDFLAGEFVFGGEGASGGRIVNQGTLTGRGGHLWFIAPEIENSGVILAEDGGLTLAAGSEVRIASLDTPGIDYLIRAPEHEIVNLGSLLAEQGSIRAFAGSLRHEGHIAADTVAVDQDGTIVISASNDIDLAAGSTITAPGGDIRVESESGTVLIGGAVDASDADGVGGTIRLLGDRVGVVGDGAVSADGGEAGGTVLLGGNLRGQGPEPNASRVVVTADASVSASGIGGGDGGTVIAFGTDLLRVQGALAARGGEQGGRGGFVETSSLGELDLATTPDVTAPAGGGEWLIDPNNIRVVNPPATPPLVTGVAPPPDTDFFITTPGGGEEQLDVTLVDTALAGGAIVTIDATGDGDPGNFIAWDANLDLSDNAFGNTLRLIAPGNVDFNGTLDDPFGTLDDIDVRTGASFNIQLGALISTPGFITVRDAAGTVPQPIIFSGGLVDAGQLDADFLEYASGGSLFVSGDLFVGSITVSGGFAELDVGGSPPFLSSLFIAPGAELSLFSPVFTDVFDLDGTISSEVGTFVDVDPVSPTISTFGGLGAPVIANVDVAFRGSADLSAFNGLTIQNGGSLTIANTNGFAQNVDIDLLAGGQLANESTYTLSVGSVLNVDGVSSITNAPPATFTQDGDLFLFNGSLLNNFGTWNQNGLAVFDNSTLATIGTWVQIGLSDFITGTLSNDGTYDQTAPLGLLAGSVLDNVSGGASYFQSADVSMTGASQITNSGVYTLVGEISSDGSPNAFINDPGALLDVNGTSTIPDLVIDGSSVDVGLGVSLSLTGDVDLINGGSFINDGSVTQAPATVLSIASASSLLTGPTGDFTQNGETVITGNSSLANDGLFDQVGFLDVDNAFVDNTATGTFLQTGDALFINGASLSNAGLYDQSGLATYSNSSLFNAVAALYTQNSDALLSANSSLSNDGSWDQFAFLDVDNSFVNNAMTATWNQSGDVVFRNGASLSNLGTYDQFGFADYQGAFLFNDAAGSYSQFAPSSFAIGANLDNAGFYSQGAPLDLQGSFLRNLPGAFYAQDADITLFSSSALSNEGDFDLFGNVFGDGTGNFSNAVGASILSEAPVRIEAFFDNNGDLQLFDAVTLAGGGISDGAITLDEGETTVGQVFLEGPTFFEFRPGSLFTVQGLTSCANDPSQTECLVVGPGVDVFVRENLAIPNVTLNEGVLTIEAGVQLQADGTFIQQGGAIRGDGVLAISGTAAFGGFAVHENGGLTDLLGGATATLSGPELALRDGRFFRVTPGANLDILDGSNLFLDGNATLRNEGNTALRGFASIFGFPGGPASFVNDGLLIKTDPGEATIEAGFFENLGNFDLQGGSVRMRANAAFRNGSGFNGTLANFAFDGGFHRIEEGATFGSGFALRFGTLELVDDPQIPGAFTLLVDDLVQEQSSIQGANLTITNSGTFNGGDHSGPGTTRFAPTATIDQLDLAVLGGRSIVNDGLISTPFLNLFNDGLSTATFVNNGAGPRGVRLTDAGFGQVEQIEFTNNGDFEVLPNPTAEDPNQRSSFLVFNGGSFTNSAGATFTLTGLPSFDPVEDVFAGGVFLRFNQGSTFTNLGTLQGDDVDIQATNGSTFVSSGVLALTRTLDVPPPDPFTCCSSVQITGGSDATLSGTLQFGLLNLTRGSTVQLDGSLALASLNVTTVQLPGPNGVPIETQTVLSGTGDLSVSESFSLTGGVLRLNGTVTILDGAGVNVGPERPEGISVFPSVIDGTVVLQNSNGPAGSDAINVLAGDLRLVNGGEFRNGGTLFVDNTFADAVADGVQDFDGNPITAAAPSLVTLTETAGTTFTNTGFIETRNGTPLRIDANFANAGTLSARAGDIGVVGGLQLGGTGLLGAAAGATIRVAQFQQSGGQVAGAGTFAIAGSATMTGGSNTIDTVVVESGADFTAGPAFALDGTRTFRNAGAASFSSLGLTGGATVDLAAGSTTAVTEFQQSGGTLLGAGSVAVAGTGALSGGDFGAGSAGFGILQLGGDARLGLATGTTTSVGALTQTGGTITGPGTLALSGTGSVSGGTNTAGTTNVLSGASLTVTSPFALAGGRTLQNAGSASFAGLSLADAATLNVGTGATTAVGTFSQTGGAVTGAGALEIRGTGTISGGTNSVAVTRIASGATLTATNPFALNGTRALRNAGSASFATLGVADSAVLDLAAGSTTTVGTLTVATPSLTLNGALSAQQFEITSPTLTISESGALGGIGTITGNVLNGGTLAPGNSPGTIAIEGDFTQSETGRLVIEVGGAGATAGTDFDQLNVSGSATLGGTLEVTALPDYTGALGSDFTPITYASTSGTFAAVTQTTPGTTFDLEFGPNGVRSQLTERDGETAETGFDPQNPPETVADREQAREFAEQTLEGCPEERDEVDGTNATTREQESPESATAGEGETQTPDSTAQGGQGVGCTTG